MDLTKGKILTEKSRIISFALYSRAKHMYHASFFNQDNINSEQSNHHPSDE
jgi:hypothetical protein